MLRITESQWTRLLTRLFRNTELETAGLLFAEQLPTRSGPILAVRDASVIPENAYAVRRADQIRIDPVALNRLVRPARNQGLSIFTIHTHPGASTPWFSRADDAGDARLLPSFSTQNPHTIHGSIVVVSSGEAIARGFWKGDHVAMPVRIVGRTLKNATSTTGETPVEVWFGRQELALGTSGQTRLQALRVGIVGLGGTGSIVAAQLAHQGIGHLVLIDGDKVEDTNVSRIIGATTADIGVHKVEVARRYIDRLGLSVDVDPICEPLTPRSVDALAHCDVVFSCVDRQTPRAVLNRLAYSHLVPTIDLGVGFRVDETGHVVGDAGRVVVLGPDRPCLACWGHLNPDALRAEALDDEEHEALANEGYIAGADEPQPSVMAFNTMVSGAAVIEMLRIVTAFAGAATAPQRLAFSFSQGTVRRNQLAAQPRCAICAHREGTTAPQTSPT